MRYSADKVHDDIKSRLKQAENKKRSFDYRSFAFLLPFKITANKRLSDAKSDRLICELYKKHMNIC